MFKKSAVAYSIRLGEMKRVRDVMSTQQTQPYIPTKPLFLPHTSRCEKILPACSRYFVANESDTAVRSCEQSLLSCRTEVLPLPFVVMLLIIVASGRYFLALQSCSAVSTTLRLYGDCKF